MTIKNNRGWILKTKLLIPERWWRIATKPAAAFLKIMPESVLYSLGLPMRRKNVPYSLIQTDDVVFQVGAPSDLLSVGRSRSGYFAHLISGKGKLVIMEPDSINCDALNAFAKRHGLSDRILVVNAGAWSEEKELKFYQSREHPASAVLVELCEATPQEMKRRGYHEISVPVKTIDGVIAEYGLNVPKLVSLTTNGAEIQILEGMTKTITAGGAPYISLAVTGDGYAEEMSKLGYERIANDDRGFTFSNKN